MEAFFVINLYSGRTFEIKEDDDDDLPTSPIFMRTRKFRCTMCGNIYGDTIIPGVVRKSCIFCQEKILVECAKRFDIYHKKGQIHKELRYKLNEEIIEFGLRPDRVFINQLLDLEYFQ